jgi:hypothetical protein
MTVSPFPAVKGFWMLLSAGVVPAWTIAARSMKSLEKRGVERWEGQRVMMSRIKQCESRDRREDTILLVF